MFTYSDDNSVCGNEIIRSQQIANNRLVYVHTKGRFDISPF